MVEGARGPNRQAEERSAMKRLLRCIGIASLVVLLVPDIVRAQATFSTADLAGTWRLFQLATPTGTVDPANIRSYSGVVAFDATGAVTGGELSEVTTDPSTGDQITSTVQLTGGALTLSAVGVLGGAITLDGGPDTLEVREARALTTRFTIVGASTVRGQAGLFTLVRRDPAQTFTLDGDIATDGTGDGQYSYHEITPSDAGVDTLTPPLSPGDASWSSGKIVFHGSPPNFGCTEAELVRADGTIRAQRVEGQAQSFG
jgi:hypothetical protein